MEWIAPLVVAAVLAVAIVLAARRWRGDRPGDHGPPSRALESRATIAAQGSQSESPSTPVAKTPGTSDRPKS